MDTPNRTPSPSQRRRKIWIDSFQTKLLIAVLSYCLIYQASVWAAVAVWNQFGQVVGISVDEPMSPNSLIPALVCFLALAPVICITALRMTHRLVGPLVPIRRAINAVRKGTPVETVRLREGDYLGEFRDEINAMLEELEKRGAITIHRPGAWGTAKSVEETKPATAGVS